MTKEQRNNIKRRPLALILIIALCIGILPINQTPASKAASRAGYGLSNPSTSSDGVTTWDCVWFGNYPQSDATGATKEPIKWRVLSVNGDDAFLLADQNLDVQRYNDTYTSITWETCTMRSWLNSSFLNKAFTASEQAAIKNTTVVNEDNSSYGTEGGNNTTDKVYLLSLSEVLNPSYGFTSTTGSTDTRKAVNTAYVAAGGEINSSYMSSAGSTDYWWLRSPGHYSDNASHVDSDGDVIENGNSVDYDHVAARPALHLNLSSTSSWSYAGKVTSKGGENVTGTPVPVQTPTQSGGEILFPAFSIAPTPTMTPEPPKNKAARNVAAALPDMGNLGNAELKGPELSIGGNTFNLFKMDMEMSLPIFNDVEYNIDLAGHTAEVLIGIDGAAEAEVKSDPDDPYWRESYQQVKSLVKACGGKVDTTKLWNRFSKLRGKLKKIEGSAAFKVKGNAAGYLKLQLDEEYNPVGLIEGGVTAGLEASGKVKAPLWWIIYSEFGVGGSVDGSFCLKMGESKTICPEGELGLAIKPSVALGADAVVVDIKGGIEGEIGGGVKIPWQSFQESVNAYLTGKAFIQVDTIVPGLSGGYDYEFPKLELYPDLGQITKRSLDVQYTRSEKPTKQMVGEIKKYASGAVDTAEDALVYENAKPEMVKLPDGRILMTYLDDKTENAKGQAKLMYRLYNAGTWTEEKPVNSSANLDMAGKLCVHDGTAYIIYENSGRTVTENMTQKEILDGMELYIAAFDASKNSFGTPQRIGVTLEDTWKYGYDFAGDGEDLYAVWAENSDGDVFLEHGSTELYRSRLTADGWGAKEKLHSEPGAVQEFCVQVKDGNTRFFYSKNKKLYVDGWAVSLSRKNVDSVKVFDGTVYFRVDGQLYSWDEETEEAVRSGIACTSSYRVMDGTVYWTEQDNFKSEVWRSVLPKSGSVSTDVPVKVTNEGGYIGSFCLSSGTGAEPVMAYTLQRVEEMTSGENPYGLTLLMFRGNLSRSQGEVTNVAYDILSFKPGEENEVTVTIANTGTTELNHIIVTIRDKNGNTLHEEEVSVSLQPGETRDAVLSVEIPEDFAEGDIIASVRADEPFVKGEEAQYEAELQTCMADLELREKDSDTVIIKNKAEDIAQNVTIFVRDQDETGTLLMEKTVGTLEAGEQTEISVNGLWKNTTADAQTGQNYLYCEASQEEDEYELWNNSLRLAKESRYISSGATGTVPPTGTPVLPGNQHPAVADAASSGTGTSSQTASSGSSKTSGSYKAPAKVTALKLKAKKKALQVSWKKVSGASGYQIWYSTSKKFKKKSAKTVKKPKLTIKKLKSGKTYFVKVRAYTLKNGKKVYGAWSKTMKKKVKK
ncbi:MAG: DUF6273 domain-containing protein [Roseburia sp.]|nr:DUF6273 domain-containing protein [Roseburia sp.]